MVETVPTSGFEAARDMGFNIRSFNVIDRDQVVQLPDQYSHSGSTPPLINSLGSR